MAESKDEILEYLKRYQESKEQSDTELVKIESRVEKRITEVKQILKVILHNSKQT